LLTLQHVCKEQLMRSQIPAHAADVGQLTVDRLGNELDLYSERARLSLVEAEREARGLNHNYIGTEHLLLGLFAVADGVAAKTLANLGLEVDRVRQTILNTVGAGREPIEGEIGLTPRAKRSLELARDEARQLNHHYVGTEHIFLGLTREGEGIAAGVLSMLDVDIEKARAEVTLVLGSLPKGNVVACRVPPRDLEAIDLLVAAGIRNTRSDAASWLIHAGIESNRELFEKVQATVAEIRRLRRQVQEVALEMTGGHLRSKLPASAAARSAEKPATESPPPSDPNRS
jgi:ATP-dependent Clp protease ATP-binding subunit ClpA